MLSFFIFRSKMLLMFGTEKFFLCERRRFMPTSSITKEFVIRSDEAAKRLIDLKPEDESKKQIKDDSFEKGKELLKSLRVSDKKSMEGVSMASRIMEEAAQEAVLNRGKEMITMKLRKGWSPERLHEEDEYPMDLILEVQKELQAEHQ